MNIREPVSVFERTEQGVSISNIAMHPTRGMMKLPQSRLKRAWLVLRGYEIYSR